MRPVTAPREIVINVTLRCPLKCAHCCFSSDMFQQGHLSLDQVKQAISEAATVPSIELLHFVGGDPFLHADIMAEAIGHGRAHGLGAGATTSAYWAKTPARATSILRPLVEAGLTELTISYDDAHAAFVRLETVVNAVRAALAFGLKLRINVTIGPDSTLTAALLRERLGLTERPDVKVYETEINATGRALESGLASSAPAPDPAARARPCLSVLRSFTVTHEGDIHPCCGVLPHYDGLRIGRLDDGGLRPAIDRAYNDPLFKWLAFEGPAAILNDVRGDDLSAHQGLCAACDCIFRDPDMLEKVRARAEQQRDRIAAYEFAYRAAGLYAPPEPIPAEDGS